MKITLKTKKAGHLICIVHNREGDRVVYSTGCYYTNLDNKNPTKNVDSCMFQIKSQNNGARDEDYPLLFANGELMTYAVSKAIGWTKDYRHSTIEEIAAFLKYKKED